MSIPKSKSNSKLWIVVLIVAVFFLFKLIISQQSKSAKRSNLSEINLSEIDKSKVFEMSFKEMLKKEGNNLDIDLSNKFETLQPGNKYSNHYFSISTKFPDGWSHDRGVGEYAIFRTFEEDSALTIALIVIPIKGEDKNSSSSHLLFQEAPLAYLNESFNGDYKGYLLDQFKKSTNLKVYDFKIQEKKVRTTNYVSYSYKFDEVNEDYTVTFINCSYMTIIWGKNVNIGYTAPEVFYDQEVIDDAVFNTNFVGL